MFEQPTVFILGAGASWHYGYPTGDILVREVKKKGEVLARYYEHSCKVGNPQRPKFFKRPAHMLQDDWQEAWDKCSQLNRAIKTSNPLVIDYFLGQNPALQEVGKLLIGWVLLERNYQSLHSQGNVNRHPSTRDAEDDWCRFLNHHLTIGCRTSQDLLENKVSFITFNYDASLEARLSEGLRHEIFEAGDIQKFLSGSRIIHVYGKLGDLPSRIPWAIEHDDPEKFNEFNWGNYHTDFTRLLNAVHDASADIRVIDPDNKGDDSQSIAIARHQIHNAKRLFILGYGFDLNNNQRLQLSENIRQPKKRVYFTNFQNARNINKKVSKIIFEDENHFVSNSVEAGLYERSACDVYQAFAGDFNL